jgi:hypothetical protein
LNLSGINLPEKNKKVEANFDLLLLFCFTVLDYNLGFWLKPIECYYLPPAEAGGY